MQVHKQLMLQIMPQRIAAHHLLCLFVQLAIDKDQWLIKIHRLFRQMRQRCIFRWFAFLSHWWLRRCILFLHRLIQYRRALIPNEVFKHVHLMTGDVIIIRFPDPILIDIREKFHLFFLHFTSKRVCIFLWLRGEHDCFF